MIEEYIKQKGFKDITIEHSIPIHELFDTTFSDIHVITKVFKRDNDNITTFVTIGENYYDTYISFKFVALNFKCYDCFSFSVPTKQVEDAFDRYLEAGELKIKRAIEKLKLYYESKNKENR